VSCPLYMSSTSGNPLKVCGPTDRIGYAPSSAHVKTFCLSVSAYNHCPNYKLKTRDWESANWWWRLLNRVSVLFIR